MCGFFKKIFSSFKGDEPLIDTEVSTSVQSRKNIKTKKNKGTVVDKSTDNSTSVAGDGNTVGSNNATNNYFLGNSPTDDLIIIARWKNLVPHKIVTQKNGLDEFNLLVPDDPNYVESTFDVELTEQYDEQNAVYVLVQRNPFIKNLKLKGLKMNLDTCQYESTECKSIIGILDTPKAFAIQCSKFRVGNGQITLVFQFDKEKKHYRQEFNFEVLNNHNEFIIRNYTEPELDIDWDKFSF